jgi:hypothetical protein
VATVELGGDESREAGGGAAGGGGTLAVDRVGVEDEPGTQARSHATALIDAPQGVVRLGEAYHHPLDLLAKAAHGEKHVPSHLELDDVREDEARARDCDPQPLRGGMMLALPRNHVQSRRIEARRSNTCFGAVA